MRKPLNLLILFFLLSCILLSGCSPETLSFNEIDETDLSFMSPFEYKTNGLVVLYNECPLIFNDIETTPRIDGATAAYPVYAALAQASFKGLEKYIVPIWENNRKLQAEGKSDQGTYFKGSVFVDSTEYPLNKIMCSKTNGAYERLINGECDIIFCAEPSKAQLELVAKKGDEFVLTQVASEAFVFFVNTKNKVDNLKLEEIQKIYTGEIKKWSKVGGSNKEIIPYQRPENSGSQTIMENRVMKGLKILPKDIQKTVDLMGGMVERVASFENSDKSIGYSFLYYSSKMVVTNKIKYIGVNGIMPNRENIINKAYPLTIPVYAVTLKSNKDENTAKFLEFCRSDYAQEIINKTGYVGIK